MQSFQPMTGIKAVFTPLLVVTALVLVASIFKRGPGLRIIRLLAILSAVLSCARAYLTSTSIDFQVFYNAGLDTIQGRNPYVTDHPGVMPFLYPPNVLPLFCGLAVFDYETSRSLWIGLNVAFSLALAPLAWIALRLQQPKYPALRPEIRAGLVAFVPMTTSIALTIDVGQIALWFAISAYLALIAQSLRRPIVAGLCLSLALFKATSALPYFSLFLRRSDRMTWVVLVLVCLFLSISARPSTNPIPDIQAALVKISANARLGALNDYSLDNQYSYSIIGVDHTLSRLGMDDRRAVGLLQLGILGSICFWLAWEVLIGKTLDRAALFAVVTIVAVLFFYHRLYDTVVLVLPMTYAIWRADTTASKLRWKYVAAAVLLMIPMSAPAAVMKQVYDRLAGWPIAEVIYRSLVLTMPTWSILAAAGLLVWTGYTEPKHSDQNAAPEILQDGASG